MTTEPVLLAAAGGLARETLAAIRAGTGQHVIGILDDDPTLHGRLISGVPVLGGLALARDHQGAQLVLCAGSGKTRSAMVDRLGATGIGSGRFATVVHPSVSAPPETKIGEGAILLAGVVVTADVVIGSHVVAMPRVTLTHDDVISDFATLCAGVSLGGGVRVGKAAFLGMNASVRPYLEVGAGSILGMGAALLSNLPAHQRWAGVPAGPLVRSPMRTYP